MEREERELEERGEADRGREEREREERGAAETEDTQKEARISPLQFSLSFSCFPSQNLGCKDLLG